MHQVDSLVISGLKLQLKSNLDFIETKGFDVTLQPAARSAVRNRSANPTGSPVQPVCDTSWEPKWKHRGTQGNGLHVGSQMKVLC